MTPKPCLVFCVRVCVSSRPVLASVLCSRVEAQTDASRRGKKGLIKYFRDKNARHERISGKGGEETATVFNSGIEVRPKMREKRRVRR